MSNARHHWTRTIRPGAWVMLSAALPAVGAVTLAAWAISVPGNAAWLDAWGPGGGGLAVVGFLLILGVVGCGLSVVPTHAVGILAGWSLGLVAGGAVAWLGVVAAAMLGYELARLIGGRGLERWIESSARARSLHAALLQRAEPGADPHEPPVGKPTGHRVTWLVGLTRLSPVFPFAATNALLAAVAVPRRAVLLGTAWGMVPRLGVGVALGAGLSELSLDANGGPWVMGLGIAATLAVLWVIGRVARQQWRRATAGVAVEPVGRDA